MLKLGLSVLCKFEVGDTHACYMTAGAGQGAVLVAVANSLVSQFIRIRWVRVLLLLLSLL